MEKEIDVNSEIKESPSSYYKYFCKVEKNKNYNLRVWKNLSEKGNFRSVTFEIQENNKETCVCLTREATKLLIERLLTFVESEEEDEKY